jgi:hypothetical protein
MGVALIPSSAKPKISCKKAGRDRSRGRKNPAAPNELKRRISMRFLVKTRLWVFLLTLALFASSPSSGRESQTKPRARFPFAYVQNDCGPADGAALTFRFTLKESKCGKYEEPFIVISIIGNLPTFAPQDYPIGSGSRVLARRCLIPGQCEAVTSGNLHLANFSKGKSASGEYELHFRDGSVEKGSFDAVRCVMTLICR